jgi:hypothetical protein
MSKKKETDRHLKDLQKKNEELQSIGEVLKNDFLRRGSKDKEVKHLLRKLHEKGEVVRNEIEKLISKNRHTASEEIRKSISKTEGNILEDDKPATNEVGTDQRCREY